MAVARLTRDLRRRPLAVDGLVRRMQTRNVRSGTVPLRIFSTARHATRLHDYIAVSIEVERAQRMFGWFAGCSLHPGRKKVPARQKYPIPGLFFNQLTYFPDAGAFGQCSCIGVCFSKFQWKVDL